MKEGFNIRENLRINVYDEDGNVIDYRETYKPDKLSHRIKNALGFNKCLAEDLIVDVGLADVVEMISNRYEYISIGSGTTTTEHGDTEMESEVMDRVVAATSISTTFYANDTVTFRGTFTPDSNYTISESGIHVAASGDIMFARETFTPLSVIASRSFDVAWSIILMR